MLYPNLARLLVLTWELILQGNHQVRLLGLLHVLWCGDDPQCEHHTALQG